MPIKIPQLIDQIKATIPLWPLGQTWELITETSSNLYAFHKVLCTEVVEIKSYIKLMYAEFYCSQHTSLSDDIWKREYGLPSPCDPRSQTLCLIANGLPKELTISEIIQFALAIIGITASVINEEVETNVTLTYSIIIESSSEIFGDCLVFMGANQISFDPGNAAIDPDAGVDDESLAIDPDSLTTPNAALKAVDPDKITQTICPPYVADSENPTCENQMYLSETPYNLIPVLRCIFEDFIPEGYDVYFYLDNKNNPLEI